MNANITTAKGDRFFKFIHEMQDRKDYLKIRELKDKHSYKICARNAYVGIWKSCDESFLISRYEVGPNPYLSHEYHWDTGEPLGTVKPIELIEKCPLEIKESYDKREENHLLNYLNDLEKNNPIIEGFNSLQERIMAAINFERRLAGK